MAENKSNSNEWTDFGAGKPFTAAKHPSQALEASETDWMAQAAVTGEALTPMAPPGTSPQKGSARSKARWSSKLATSSKYGSSVRRSSSSSRVKPVAESRQDGSERGRESKQRSSSRSTALATSVPESEEQRDPPPASSANLTDRTASSSSGSSGSIEPLPKPPMDRKTSNSKSRHRSNSQGPVVRKSSSSSASAKVKKSSSNKSVDGATKGTKARSSSPMCIIPGRDSSVLASEKSRSTKTRQSSRGRSVKPVKTTTRGRSHSQTRRVKPHTTKRKASLPPLTKDNNRRRARSRSRSASLTRISNLSSPTNSVTLRNGRATSSLTTVSRCRAVSEGCDARSTTSGGSNRVMSSYISFDASETGDIFRGGNKKRGFIEKLFGNSGEKPVSNRAITGSLGYEIRPRILLAATVYHNTATNLWITTINTNQRGVAKNPATANKFLKAFSFPTEREARESAIANAPPKMVPFNESPACFSCKGKFAVFRRAGHCRNCGVCVCASCSTSWPAKMIPATYNLKNEAQVRICLSCNALSSSFKKALLDGDLEEAIALYGTGNVNLRTPFPVSNKKDELMHPVHCAVQGGNLSILQWLIDDHFCPFKIHRAGSNKKTNNKRGSPDSLIMTSKGRSVLDIALDHLKVDVLRYLVVDCGVSVFESRDLKAAQRALEAAMFELPAAPTYATRSRPETPGSTRWDHASFDDVSEPSSLGADDCFGGDESITVGGKSGRSRGSRASSRNGDACIICFDRKIDSVCTPCGHQVCCVSCTKNLTTCPVCNARGNFIKIFRP